MCVCVAIGKHGKIRSHEYWAKALQNTYLSLNLKVEQRFVRERKRKLERITTIELNFCSLRNLHSPFTNEALCPANFC